MARYIVRFMKDVLGENGHEAEICQRSMEVDAADKLNASDLAKVRRKFERTMLGRTLTVPA
jgi:hypothetical protein